jgi:hypothetical protein
MSFATAVSVISKMRFSGGAPPATTMRSISATCSGSEIVRPERLTSTR